MYQYKYFVLGFFFFTISLYHVKAQQTNQHKHTVELYFDSAGRVISFPPAILREGKKIDPRVVIPHSFFFGEIERMRSLLIKAYDSLTERNTYKMYECYYKNDTAFDFIKYVDHLGAAIRGMDKETFNLADTSRMMDSLRKATYLPAHAFMQNLLYNQYELRIFRGDVLVEKRKLNIVSYDKENKCFYFTTRNIRIKDLDCRSCGRQPHQLSFRLFKTNPFDLAMKDWFEAKNEVLKTEFSKGVETAFKQMAATSVENALFNTLNDNIGALKHWLPYWFWYTGGEIALDPFHTPDTKALNDSIRLNNKVGDTLTAQKKYYDSILSRVNFSAAELEVFENAWVIRNNLVQQLDNADTILSQIKKELAKTNPAPSSARLAELSTQFRRNTNYRDSINQQKIFIESVLLRDNNATGKFEVFKVIYPRLQLVMKKIDSLSKRGESFAKNLNRRLPTSFNTQAINYLNRVTLFVSQDRIIRPQIQYDASNNYEGTAKTKRALNRVTELPDNESGIIIIHNLDSITKLKFTHTRLSFKDEPEFTQLISDQLSKIDLTKLSAAELATIQDFTRSFFRVSTTHGAAGAADSCRERTLVLYKKLQQLAGDFVAKNSTGIYAQSIFAQGEPVIPVYHSETETVKFRSETAYKDSISVGRVVGTKDTAVMQTFVKVGRLKFVQLASGIAVTDHAVAVTTVDTVGGFRVSATDNKARAIIGFKIYPFQHYSRDRWLIPRYPLRRLGVFAGFEMLRPLNNFYLGGSYDIVPGLAFSAGANFYLKTTYKIENNIVTDSHKSYDSKGLYYSVTIDPELFVKFIKLFFK